MPGLYYLRLVSEKNCGAVTLLGHHFTLFYINLRRLSYTEAQSILGYVLVEYYLIITVHGKHTVEAIYLDAFIIFKFPKLYCCSDTAPSHYII